MTAVEFDWLESNWLNANWKELFLVTNGQGRRSPKEQHVCVSCEEVQSATKWLHSGNVNGGGVLKRKLNWFYGGIEIWERERERILPETSVPYA